MRAAVIPLYAYPSEDDDEVEQEKENDAIANIPVAFREQLKNLLLDWVLARIRTEELEASHIRMMCLLPVWQTHGTDHAADTISEHYGHLFIKKSTDKVLIPPQGLESHFLTDLFVKLRSETDR